MTDDKRPLNADEAQKHLLELHRLLVTKELKPLAVWEQTQPGKLRMVFDFEVNHEH